MRCVRPLAAVLANGGSLLLLGAILALAGCDKPTIDLTGLGDRGHAHDAFSDLEQGTVIDARGTSWIVSNSRIEDDGGWCDDPAGERQTNPYPIRVYRSPGVTIKGALVAGEVSQSAPWGAAYCNSAAVAVFDSPGATVADVRIDAGWDAVRHAERDGSADGHRTEHLWVTRNRDDCIEADAMNAGSFEDILCESFVGISAANRNVSKPENTLTIRGVLLSLLEYDYRGTMQSGPPIKLNAETAIGLSISDSVIVLNSRRMVGGGRQFERLRASIRECENNLLIWPFDTPLPAFVGLPDCFTLVAGSEKGRRRWQEIRQNWIDCHPDVPRLSEDPDSQPQDCNRDEYGGQY